MRAMRREVVEPALSAHQGRLVKTTGDGFLAEFASPVEAVRCAVSIQGRVAKQGVERTGSSCGSGSISATSSSRTTAMCTATG